MEFKKYNHSKEEKKISDFWIKKGLFKPKKNKSNKKFSIVIPPPNVTGRLHMGHALNNSLQDVLVRFNRMKGLETLWQPGTDHAGIATQAVVENNLLKEGIKKDDLGREKFIKKIWDWKEQSGGIILDQLKKLGCSCDWSRTRFTMDKDLSRAVIKVFVDLYNNKLIYKDKKLVNWDTKLQTAISDLEVNQKDVQSQLYYIDYTIENSDQKITIATTRPETMMGDTAVAVNPKDERYVNLVGKNVLIPIVNRTVKIISDNYADPDQGSGAVKITPAHDFNDYEVGKRNKLEIINIFEENGKINKNGIKEFHGLDRFEARKLIIKKLKDKGSLVKIENIKNKVPYGDRSNTIIEPFLTEQWFVDAKKLSGVNSKDILNLALYEAKTIVEEDISFCKNIGLNGLKIIEEISNKKKNTVNILTHCNAGWLATIDWGTATSPIYHAHQKGIKVHVWVDETRPRNQGANLTSYELNEEGISNTVITDNAGGILMQRGEVDMCIVGTDRTLSNGDVCNKIGTYLKALSAKDNNVPFYVALPSSTIDWNIKDHKQIPIEERNSEELSHVEGVDENNEIKKVRIYPQKSKSLNLAFDVTPAKLVKGLITEKGICEASEKGLKGLFK